MQYLYVSFLTRLVSKSENLLLKLDKSIKVSNYQIMYASLNRKWYLKAASLKYFASKSYRDGFNSSTYLYNSGNKNRIKHCL